MEESTNNRPARRRTPPAAAPPVRKRAPGDAKFQGKFILALVVLLLFFKKWKQPIRSFVLTTP